MAAPEVVVQQGQRDACIAGDVAESRFEPSKAKKLTPEQAKVFGPAAGKYRYDATMIRAAEIAARRAQKK